MSPLHHVRSGGAQRTTLRSRIKRTNYLKNQHIHRIPFEEPVPSPPCVQARQEPVWLAYQCDLLRRQEGSRFTTQRLSPKFNNMRADVSAMRPDNDDTISDHDLAEVWDMSSDSVAIV